MANEPVPLTHATLAETQFKPGLAMSLTPGLCSHWPEENGPDLLMVLTQDQPGMYLTFLGKLIAGSTFKSACFSCGIPYSGVWSWLRQGAADLADSVDTYCSRFVLDIQRACGLAVGNAEERLFTKDPAKWLARGPGKDFHRGKYWKELEQQQVDEDIPQEDNPIEPLPLQETQEALEDKSEKEAEADLAAAMKVLEDQNIITKPEFIAQVKEQFRMGDG